VDAVTTVEALEFLREREQQLPGLRVRAFLHTNARSLFHPKFALFASSDTGTLVAGSGNLTAAGLGRVEPAGSAAGNWEAYTVTTLDQDQLNDTLKMWEAWRRDQEAQHRLRPLEDDDVLNKAIENARMGWTRTPSPSSSTRTPPSKPATTGGQSPTHTASSVVTTPAFICEIPSGSSRWGQANFHAEEFEAYFGFEGRSGESAEVVIQSVRPDGTLSAPERRPPVRVASRNFRVELGAAKEFPYEKSGADDRPIVIFIRVGNRAFRYCLLMPSDADYPYALALLPSQPTGRRLMRSRTLDADEVKSAWPDAPAKLFPEHTDLPEI
jgi:hypothetical protein